MRLILCVIFWILVSIISIPLYLLELIFHKVSPGLEHRLAQFMTIMAFKIWLFFAGTKLTVTGIEEVPFDRPCMFVSNHRGFFDIIVLISLLKCPVFIVAKKELKYLPCINFWMFFLRCLFLDRNDLKSNVEVVKTGIQQIKSGLSVYIMPEGTRNKGEGILKFHEGSFKYSTRTGAPIVPVVMTGTAEIFEQQFPWIKKSHVTVDFLEPVYPDKMEKDELKHIGAYVHDKMESALEKRMKM